ncbi:MAG: ABC transporter substrate-binding protein [Thermomicrobiales bacterium]
MTPNPSRLTRRSALLAAAGFGAATLLPQLAHAQDATPAAGPITSPTRAEAEAALAETLGYAEAATTGGTFIRAIGSDPATLQPLLADDEDSIGLVQQIYSPLIGTDLVTGGPAPTGLADSWDIAADGRTYTFHLNPDAQWHDGEPVTAADVQFSFDALANPDAGSSYAQTFLAATESWRVIDDHTFEVIAKEPLFTFLYDLVTWIIPQHIWAGVPPADWRTDGGATGQDPARVVGSGPFRFREWLPGESVTLDRNPDSFAHAPYIDTYTVVIRPDQTAIVNALLGGEIDAATLEPADVATVSSTDGLAVATYPTPDFIFYLTNLDPEKSTLFQDVEVRQALMVALDREAMARDILLGAARVANGTQPEISYAYAPDRLTTQYTFDVARAQELLADAGWADSDGDGIVEKDGTPLAFEILYPSGSPTYDQELAYMQDAWRAIGVDAQPSPLDFPALVGTITGDHAFDMAFLGFGWDATYIQDLMFGCDQYEGGFNVVRYCNPALDEINARAKRTLPEAPRRELMIAATDMINEDLPVGVLHFVDANLGYSTRLQNFAPTAWGLDLTQIWITDTD